MLILQTLGFAFILVNVFDNVHATFPRLYAQLQPDGNTVSFLEVVEKTGYQAEERFVTTEDGYILTVHRMFAGPKSPPAPKKPVVLFIPGMAASSDIWTIRGPSKDLVYRMVDEGIDVWILNVRGNVYSRKHRRLSPKLPEFWRFSWHEIGLYDLPATIDHILRQTGEAKVTLVGHSMGGTVSYVLLSLRPEYNEKVDLVIGFAPVAIFTRQSRGPGLDILLPFSKKVITFLKRNGVYELFPRTSLGIQFLTGFCSQPGVRQFCKDIIFLAAGSVDVEQFDDAFVSTLFNHYPCGMSVDMVEHYRQNMANESFREFDFGPKENQVRYGNVVPPEYPLENITAPVVSFCALNDAYVQPADLEAFDKRLTATKAETRFVPYPKFNHFDFVLAKDSKTLLYDDVMDTVMKYKTTWRSTLS